MSFKFHSWQWCGIIQWMTIKVTEVIKSVRLQFQFSYTANTHSKCSNGCSISGSILLFVVCILLQDIYHMTSHWAVSWTAKTEGAGFQIISLLASSYVKMLNGSMEISNSHYKSLRLFMPGTLHTGVITSPAWLHLMLGLSCRLLWMMCSHVRTAKLPLLLLLLLFNSGD